MLRLYSSIIQSHMSYCVELWGNCNKSFLLPIIKAQKMAVRIVCDLKAREHTSTYFKELNILKFPHLVEAKIKVTYKYIFQRTKYFKISTFGGGQNKGINVQGLELYIAR